MTFNFDLPDDLYQRARRALDASHHQLEQPDDCLGWWGDTSGQLLDVLAASDRIEAIDRIEAVIEAARAFGHDAVAVAVTDLQLLLEAVARVTI